MERMASDSYRAMADCYRSSHEIREFLLALSADENLHRRYIEEAGFCWDETDPDYPADVALDPNVVEAIESRFREMNALIAIQTPSLAELSKFIVTVETSEWNEYFLYVVHHLVEIDTKFDSMAREIERHEKSIEEFLAGIPEGHAAIEDLRALEPLHKPHIVVAEDNAITRMFVSALMSKFARVTEAADGQSALDAVEGGSVDLVVSDVDMPRMNGFDLFNRVKRLSHAPEFVFITGDVSHTERFARLQVPFLIKPILPTALARVARSALHLACA